LSAAWRAVPPASAVADVGALFGLDGWLTPPLRPFVHAAEPVTGRALTVQLGPADPGVPVPPLAPLYELLSKDLSGCVVVLAGAGALEGAVWGEILSRAARHQGAVAALVDGGARDRNGCVEEGLPVYAADERVVGPRGQVTVVAHDVPVRVGAVEITPGDVIVADGSGAVRVRAADAGRLLRAAASYAAGEERVLAALDRGEPLMVAIAEKMAAVATLRDEEAGGWVGGVESPTTNTTPHEVSD
jgi:regulator of RNase E activity RraA